MYDAVGYLEKELADITAREFLDVVRAHAEEGVDFMTIHAGINRRAAEAFRRSGKTDEYRFQRRFSSLCMDGDDGKGKSVLRILRRAAGDSERI